MLETPYKSAYSSENADLPQVVVDRGTPRWVNTLTNMRSNDPVAPLKAITDTKVIVLPLFPHPDFYVYDDFLKSLHGGSGVNWLIPGPVTHLQQQY